MYLFFHAKEIKMNKFLDDKDFIMPKCLTKAMAHTSLLKLQEAIREWNNSVIDYDAFGDDWNKAQIKDVNEAESLISSLNSKIKISLLTLKT